MRQPRRRAVQRPVAGRPRRRAAGRPLDSGHPRQLRRHRVRNRRAEGDPGPRRERLHAGREAQPRDDRHLQRRRHAERARRPLRGHGPFRRARADRARSGFGRPAREGRGLYEQRGLLRADQRRHRAEAVDAVVSEDGRAVQTRIAGRYGRHGASGSLEVQERLPALDGERARLVHLAPAVVGSADSGLLSPDGRLCRGRNARAGAGAGPCEKRQSGPKPARAAAGPGRTRHVVLVVAVADLGIRRHQPPR